MLPVYSVDAFNARASGCSSLLYSNERRLDQYNLASAGPVKCSGGNQALFLVSYNAGEVTCPRKHADIHATYTKKQLETALSK